MFPTARQTAQTAALLLAALPFVGCEKNDAASTNTPPAQSSNADTPAARNDDAPDSADTPSADAASTPAVPTPDVPLPPSAQDNPMKAGFIFFGANEKPAPVAAFYKKELPAKGWKFTRENSLAIPGSTLANIVQEYTKGNEVLTVSTTEQAGTEDASFVLIMDIPLPPKTSLVAPTGLITIVDVPEAPDAALAWFAKELPPRGWTAAAHPTGAGPGKRAEFKKTGRNLTITANPAGAGKTGSTLQLMHLADAN